MTKQDLTNAEQMTNDILYIAMRSFIDRKAKELRVDETEIYLKIDEQDKCIDTFVDLGGDILCFEGSEHTSDSTKK